MDTLGHGTRMAAPVGGFRRSDGALGDFTVNIEGRAVCTHDGAGY